MRPVLTACDPAYLRTRDAVHLAKLALSPATGGVRLTDNRSEITRQLGCPARVTGTFKLRSVTASVRPVVLRGASPVEVAHAVVTPAIRPVQTIRLTRRRRPNVGEQDQSMHLHLTPLPSGAVHNGALIAVVALGFQNLPAPHVRATSVGQHAVKRANATATGRLIPWVVRHGEPNFGLIRRTLSRLTRGSR